MIVLILVKKVQIDFIDNLKDILAKRNRELKS